MRVEVSNDGGVEWTLLEQIVFGYGGWETSAFDLFALIQPTDDMRLRFHASDGVDDGPVEAAIDEVQINGIWVECQDHTPPSAMAPNPVGDSLRLAATSGGHVTLSWDPPPVDASHDAATLYPVERATSPSGPFAAVGSATEPDWIDVDALKVSASAYYRVRAANPGGIE